jgi:hypothetical protein
VAAQTGFPHGIALASLQNSGNMDCCLFLQERRAMRGCDKSSEVKSHDQLQFSLSLPQQQRPPRILGCGQVPGITTQRND